MPREAAPARRRTWRQKVVIRDTDKGSQRFYVDFGEYEDGRLCELFIVAHKLGTFARGVLDSLARLASIALQTGTSPLEVARNMRGQNYPPQGLVDAPGSTVTECDSIIDYIGREIQANYGEDGKRL